MNAFERFFKKKKRSAALEQVERARQFAPNNPDDPSRVAAANNLAKIDAQIAAVKELQAVKAAGALQAELELR